MADEFKTLLKIEGDAAGAKRAATEAKSATEQVGQASAAANEQAAQSSRKTSAAIEDGTKKTGKATSGFEKMAASMGTSERAAMAFKEALARISPQMAGLLDVGIKFEQIMSFGLSKIGLLVAGVSLSIGAVALAWTKVQDAIRSAEAAAQRFADVQQRIRTEAAQKQSEAVKGAAAAGLPPSATGKVRELTSHLAMRGITPEAARAAAPYFVDESGRQVVADDEALAIAAAQQFGFIDEMKGAGRKRPIALQRARRQMRRGDTAHLAQNALDNVAAELLTRAQDMATGMGAPEIEALVQRETGLEGEALRKRTDDVINKLKAGQRKTYQFDITGRLGTKAGENAMAEIRDPLVETILSQSGQATRLFGPPESPDTLRRPQWPPASQPAGGDVHYHFNHGLQVFGPDNRDTQIPRVNR
ncbi:MAG: hypothetical protein JW741_02215 [Sedimentisphaerales bacterium]|nr:hypothetical protein [Sedimentisphaerales bacterium]